MSQESNEKLRRFEQKMHDQGADGFADGPRPWETWDESGHPANNRIWEGSAKRVNGKYKKHSLGHRLLSGLAFIALATLLVGIGGVYYTHTHTQQLAQTGGQPQPSIDRPRPVIPSPDSKAVIVAGTESKQFQVAAAVETTIADSEVTQVTDEPENETATAITAATSTGKVPPATKGSIDSVAIETIVTEQSITTTVYTHHPRQDEAEIVAAIETTPPPFAHELAAEQQQMADARPPTVAATETEALTEQVAALSILPPPAAQASIPVLAETDIPDDTDAASSPHEDQHMAAPDSQPAEPAGEATTIVWADMGDEKTVTEPVAETAAVVSEDPGEDQADTAAVEQPAEPAGEATTIALADMSDETTVTEPVAETAADATKEQLIESMEPVIPVVKTGIWVINLSSYTWKSTANRKLALFQQQGVDAEVFEVMIKEKPMYRIRVVGFESSHSAKAAIPALEQKLKLEGAWISKR